MNGLPSVPPAGLAFGTVVIAGQPQLPVQVGDIQVVDEATALKSIANAPYDSDTKIRLLCAVLLKTQSEKMDLKKETNELKQENRELKGTIAELNNETKNNKLQITELKGENAELKQFVAREKASKELRYNTANEIITRHLEVPALFLISGGIHLAKASTLEKRILSGGFFATGAIFLRMLLDHIQRKQTFIKEAMERILIENQKITSAEAHSMAERAWDRKEAEAKKLHGKSSDDECKDWDICFD